MTYIPISWLTRCVAVIYCDGLECIAHVEYYDDSSKVFLEQILDNRQIQCVLYIMVGHRPNTKPISSVATQITHSLTVDIREGGWTGNGRTIRIMVCISQLILDIWDLRFVASSHSTWWFDHLPDTSLGICPNYSEKLLKICIHFHQKNVLIGVWKLQI